MEQKKDKGFLNKLKKAVSPKSAIGNILASVMPQLAAQLQAMEKPVEEGGMLKPGEDKIAYLVIHVDGEICLSMVPLSYDSAIGKMTVGRPIKTFSGIDALTNLTFEQ